MGYVKLYTRRQDVKPSRSVHQTNYERPKIWFPELAQLHTHQQHHGDCAGEDSNFKSSTQALNGHISVRHPCAKNHGMSIVQTMAENVGLPSAREEKAIYLNFEEGSWLRLSHIRATLEIRLKALGCPLPRSTILSCPPDSIIAPMATVA